MLKIFLLFLFCASAILPQNGVKKEIPIAVIDTLKSVDNLFSKTEYFLDKKTTSSKMDMLNSFVMDNLGNVFLNDYKTIYKFDKTGKLIKEINKQGIGPGEIKVFGKMAIDDDNNLYVEDNGSGKFVKYSNELKFLKEFRKAIIAPAQSLVIKDNKYLVCFLNTAGNEVLNVYDKDSGKPIYRGGKNNKLHRFVDAYQDGGGLVLYDSKYYYVHSLDPQIHVIDKNSEYDLLKKLPSFFETIHSKRKSIDPQKVDYSRVADFHNYGGTFFLISLRPPMDKKFLPPICDIISSKGEILKQKMECKWLNQSKKLSEGKYYRVIDMRISGNAEAGIKVRIIEMKNNW